MTVGIGLIGAGGITAGHICGYNSIPDQVKVVAVADVVEENARRRAEEVGGADVVSDYTELVGRDDVDAVDICLPHHLPATPSACHTICMPTQSSPRRTPENTSCARSRCA